MPPPWVYEGTNGMLMLYNGVTRATRIAKLLPGNRGTSITDMGPHELWDEPWEGLPEEEGAWEWDLVDEKENGPTKNPPDHRDGWKRWYIVYHEPTCTNIKISADSDPQTGQWFNPHRSSGTI